MNKKLHTYNIISITIILVLFLASTGYEIMYSQYLNGLYYQEYAALGILYQRLCNVPLFYFTTSFLCVFFLFRNKQSENGSQSTAKIIFVRVGVKILLLVYFLSAFYCALTSTNLHWILKTSQNLWIFTLFGITLAYLQIYAPRENKKINVETIERSD